MKRVRGRGRYLRIAPRGRDPKLRQLGRVVGVDQIMGYAGMIRFDCKQFF